jgi:hypothetical protein
MKDYIELCKTDHSDLGFTAEPINNDLFHWEIRFQNFDKDICKECISLFLFIL